MDAIFDIFTFLIYVYGGMLRQEWTSEGNFQKLVLSFHHARPRDPAQVFRFGRRYLYPLNQLSDPELSVLKARI